MFGALISLRFPRQAPVGRLGCSPFTPWSWRVRRLSWLSWLRPGCGLIVTPAKDGVATCRLEVEKNEVDKKTGAPGVITASSPTMASERDRQGEAEAGTARLGEHEHDGFRAVPGRGQGVQRQCGQPSGAQRQVVLRRVSPALCYGWNR